MRGCDELIASSARSAGGAVFSSEGCLRGYPGGRERHVILEPRDAVLVVLDPQPGGYCQRHPEAQGRAPVDLEDAIGR